MTNVVAIIEKNQREQVQISLESYKGSNFVAARVFFDAGGGEMRHGKQGISISLNMLNNIIEGLERAREAAIEQRWIE